MHFCILIVNFSHVFDFSFDIFPFGLSSFASWKNNNNKFSTSLLSSNYFFFYILFSLNGSNLSNGIIINDSPKKIEKPLSTRISACLEASLTHATLNGRGLKHLSRYSNQRTCVSTRKIW